MFATLLIANRSEIALRIRHTARRMGLRAIAVYSEADRDARHAREADAAVCIGGPAPRESYLDIEAIVAAARRTRADAIHPGYGFLAESPAFAEAVLDAGLAWVGPPPAAIRAMGDKAQAKRIARLAGVPVLPGDEGADQSDATLAVRAAEVGFPLAIKEIAGGGGRGLRLVRAAGEFAPALAQARSEAEHAFGDGRVLLERAVAGARHVEVQVFADAHGNCVHLGERDCSVQRRHQKLIEESPSPAVDARLRTALGAAAVAVARAAGYVGAGTVEFLLDAGGGFWFMEMNARLQVEHPVTEMLTGFDLVEWQLRVAAGEPLPARQEEIRCSGHAIEARLCAEDPAHEFLPQAGTLALWVPPETAVAFAAAPNRLRADHALESGAQVPAFYDPMIAKLIAHGATRDEARERLAAALDSTVALGLPTNKAFLAAVLRDAEFARGGATTDFLARRFARPAPLGPDAESFAIAAVLAAEVRARAAGYGEWTSWSNNPARAMRATLAAGGATEALLARCERGRYRVEVAGADLELRLVALEHARARIELDPTRTETVAFCAQGGALHLACGGASMRFEDVLHAPPAKRAAGAGDGRLVAPMNARVVAVHAKPGETVDASRALVVLEAMKMEHGLALPAAVRVTAVHVAAGVQVAPGHLLVEFEPA